jgi:tetratricopeptide (TPR) repeat protein
LPLADFKAAFQAGQYQTARWLFVQLRDDPLVSREDLAEAYCEASVVEYRAGHLRTAIAWAKVAAKMAPETNQLMLLTRISLNLIEFQRLAGDTAAAIDTGHHWLTHYGDSSEVAHRKGRFYFNLAVTHQQREEVEKALEHYELAWNHLGGVRSSHPDTSERERCLVYEVMALQNSAWLMYELDLNGVAKEIAGKARRLIPEGNSLLAREQMLLEALEAHECGDSVSVLALVNRIFSDATSIPTRQLFWLYWLAAKELVRCGKMSTANAYAAMATQAAEDTKDRRLIRLGREAEEETDGVAS